MAHAYKECLLRSGDTIHVAWLDQCTAILASVVTIGGRKCRIIGVTGVTVSAEDETVAELNKRLSSLDVVRDFMDVRRSLAG